MLAAQRITFINFYCLDIFRRQRGGNKTYRGIADLLRDKVSTATCLTVRYCHKTTEDADTQGSQ